ncbi:acetolactate synthase large subunit [Thalassococcus sp. S3]|uniref:acetolactate synthase large subunit n=1 Tax=Thalassococcus sp. S3 TaxID=2017482 RepID=UPI00102489EE|nr:acetolactate synthase large subunit [Thalassococcus sp. S3]QBF33917.1 acetolactate synthase large subunit [Thalassococcus sp. S3]
MKGADLFVTCLEDGGIDTVFALPGEETNALMVALEASSIDVVLCRHEQAAAFMASVHGRLTGRAAACLATLGPGATNLLTGVADATLDLVPLVAITGQGGRDRIARGKHSHQMIDLGQLFAPVTKLSRTLQTSAEIPGAVAEALSQASMAHPGAVHLSLPEDLAGEAVEGRPVSSPAARTPQAHPDVLAEAAARISAAKQPIILAGAGLLRAGATAELNAFAAKTGLPLATSFMAKGLLPVDHPQHLGAFGLPREDHVDRAIAASDLILAIGLDPVEYPMAKLTSDGEVPLIALGHAPIPRDVTGDIQADVVGDLKSSLPTLSGALQGRRWTVWSDAETARAALISDLNSAFEDMDQSPPSAGALVAALGQSVDEHDTILSGVGTHKLALARNFTPKRPGQIIIPNGLAGMGLALPGAIAAARLQERGRVIAVCGDGDVMMNVQDMETATRLDLSVTVVVWVDGGYGLIEDKQEKETGDRPDLSFGTVDWDHLARAFGWTHIGCDTADDLTKALGNTASAPKRRLITVPVSYSGSFA